MKIAALSSRLDRLLVEAKARSRLPFWKLDERGRDEYWRWRAHCDAMVADFEATHGAGSTYAAFRENTLHLPDMPSTVRKALYPEPTPQILVGTSPSDAAKIYQNYARPDG